ncbi:hypothetical protein ACFQZT_25670 [Paenibacillus sp. GCM10027628]|uniref:hypothetical protein n=1 Tax=Paenibacillus sp. GCM10027628 TaxID=3273413 RepID=UPI003631F5A3
MKRMLGNALSIMLVVCILLSVSLINGLGLVPTAKAATSGLTLNSSSSYLVDAFNWAKPKALSYVQTGIGSNIPSYWAGYTYRNAFYSRDVAHQTVGAHLLGLDNENFSMLKKFAQSATSARKYYPLWSFGFDGTIYGADYTSDTNFVREIPAVFELTEKSYNQYLWTGNTNWINDSDMWNYYTNSVNGFITNHDGNNNSVAEEHSTNIFQGVASYNENGEGLIESGDGIASQYQALLAYAGIQAARGDSSGSSSTQTRAANLKTYFNTNWYSASANSYIRGFVSPWTAKTDFGKENSWFMPMNLITDPGSRTDSYLDYVDSTVSGMSPFNIEAYSYLPDTFYPWGRNDQGWKWLKKIMDSRDDYPEISYTVIGHIGSNLMGIKPDAPNHKVTTLPRLPSGNPSEVAWVDLNHIPLGGHDLYVKHEGNVKTTLTHNSGPSSLTWEAQFDGSHANLIVNGISQAASTKTINGKTVSYVNVTVGTGQTATVATGDPIPQQYVLPNLIQNPGFEAGTLNWSFTSGTGASSGLSHTGSQRAWLDPGTSNKVSQTVSIPTTGTYTLSGWTAAASAGGVFGIKVNGTARTSVNLLNNTTYNQQIMSNLSLTAGDSVEVYVTGPNSSTGWVNLDDVELKLSNQLIQNPGFESGTTNWSFTSGTGANSGFSHTGSQRAWLNPGTSNKVSQTLNIPSTGTYTLSGWGAAAAPGSVFGIKVNGTVKASVNILNYATYNLQTISNISLNAGDSAEIYITGPDSSSGWVNMDDISLLKLN